METSEDSAKLNTLLTEILMAQGYQDLTSQVIRRVITLVKEVEDSLVNMLTVFGEPESDLNKVEKAESKKSVKSGAEAEGPSLMPLIATMSFGARMMLMTFSRV